jgi:hypothetical protein
MKNLNKILIIAVSLLLAYSAKAQVKIGANPNTINGGSLLELESAASPNQKGLLHSRVSLSSTTVWGLAGTQVAGMMVYNTNTSITEGSTSYPIIKGGKGVYYWDGTGWVAIKFESSSSFSYGGGAPSGACSGDVIYVDTLEASPTEGQTWTCKDGTWITYTPKNGTEWMYTGQTTDAGADKVARVWRKGYIGISPTYSPFKPAAPLHVLNDGQGSGSQDNIIIESYGSSIAPVYYGMVGTGTYTSPGYLLDNQSIIGLGGRPKIPAPSGNTPQTMINFAADGNHSATSSPTKIRFYTTDAGSNTPYVRAILKNNGYFGLGTETPTSGFTILGENGTNYLDPDSGNDIRMVGYAGTGASIKPSLIFESNRGASSGSTATTRLLQSGDAMGSIYWGNKDDIATAYIDGNVPATWTTTSHPAELGFGTTPSGSTLALRRMTIKENGFVGVGTTDPNALLHISSIADASASSNGIVSIGPDAAQRIIIDQNEIMSVTGTSPSIAPGATLIINGSPTTGVASAHTTIGYDGTSYVMSILNTGRVGIGRTPTTNDLEVAGTASKATSGSWLANSDQRLKKNINYLNSNEMLNKVLSMKGVTYEWNDNKTGMKRPDGIQYGFIAQDLQKVFPSKVQEDGQGYLQTAYGDYDFLFVEAIKALNEKINKLEIENASLKASVSKVDVLEAQLHQLKASIEELLPTKFGSK